MSTMTLYKTNQLVSDMNDILSFFTKKEIYPLMTKLNID